MKVSTRCVKSVERGIVGRWVAPVRIGGQDRSCDGTADGSDGKRLGWFDPPSPLSGCSGLAAWATARNPLLQLSSLFPCRF